MVKENKNVIEIYSSTVTKVDKVFLCYGHKTYKNFSKKRYKSKNDVIVKCGVTVLWDRNNGSYECCIGVKKFDNVIQLKGLIVHEITHAVDYIMRESDLSDMEYRAYTMQSMYQIAIESIDNIIAFKREKKNNRVKEHKCRV